MGEKLCHIRLRGKVARSTLRESSSRHRDLFASTILSASIDTESISPAPIVRN